MNGGSGDVVDGPDRDASIDELLDQAVAAINRGDRESASALAGRVLAVDRSNAEAEGLLAADVLGASGSAGEIRRLTILFADLVDSTALSTRVDPETYRLVVGRYREQVLQIVEGLEGHVASTKGDGLLAVFGHPVAHENDVHRAVRAGLWTSRATCAGSANRPSAGSVWVSTSGWACTAGWCTSMSPRTTFTGLAPISPSASANWRRPGRWWCQMSWRRSSATRSTWSAANRLLGSRGSRTWSPTGG